MSAALEDAMQIAFAANAGARSLRVESRFRSRLDLVA
jgi:hypothetical protein